MNNLFVVYNQRLAGYLMQNGFPLVRMIENSNTGKNNFLFANVPLLHDRIDKWQLEKNKSTK